MRFVAYSKFDGQPLPARNQAELDELFADGHTAEPNIEAGRGTAVTAEETRQLVESAKEAPDAGTSPGADVPDPEGSVVDERVRDDSGGEDVAGDRAGAPVPPAARKRD